MESSKKELEARWKELYRKLSADDEYKGKLAKIFWGHTPSTNCRNHHRILYIGKATSGGFVQPNASEQFFNLSKGTFWAFARRLSKALDAECGDLSNLAWSNLCKIGVTNGNPGETLAEEQRSLAVDTLRREIRDYCPTLIVCVAEGYQDNFLYEVFNCTQGVNDGFDYKDGGGRRLYYRESRDNWPPVLWMKHPQGKKSVYLDLAVKQARKLSALKTCSADTAILPTDVQRFTI